MVCIINSNNDPFFNTAAEEFILKNFSSDCFMLWQNSSSVIVGKHQNALSEIHCDFITLNNIPVIRRLSGGGAVYHDKGNINFSFITRAEKGKAINFLIFLKPIVDFLHSEGVDAEINSRNNLFIGDRKISGTAAHIYKNKVIHHGTLLFDTSEEILFKTLDTDSLKYSGNAVKSVRSPVTNISQHLPLKKNVNEFITDLRNYLTNYFISESKYYFSDSDKIEIENLSKNKYRTWEWNFGYSPPYIFQNKKTLNSFKTEIILEVKKGIIEKVEITGEKEFLKIKDIISGLPHKKETLFNALLKNGLENYIGMLF